jgi:hypothetical protein
MEDTVQITKSSYFSPKLNTIDDVIEFLELNNSKKYNSLKKYDVDRIIKLLKKTNLQINTLNDDIESTTTYMTQLKTQNNKTKKIGKAHTDRIEIFTKLFRNFKKLFEPEYCLDGGVNGSWIRQLFELPYALANNFSDIGFGNPLGHDLDLVLMNTRDINIESYNAKFIKIMKSFQEHVNLSAVSELINPIIIANKTLIQVSDNTVTQDAIKEGDPIGKKILLDIPHYIFKFKDLDDNSIFEVDILAYKPQSSEGWTTVDFNVNQYVLNEKGIVKSRNDDYWSSSIIGEDFFEFLDSIKKREAVCKIDFDTILDNTKRWGLLRQDKVSYFMQIAFVLTNRFKILNVGYTNITSRLNMIDYAINKTEECPITGCQPPYYEITLKCLHKISLMCFIGILEESKFESSEAIRCPICRNDFDVNLIDKKPEKLQYFELKNMNDIVKKQLENCYLEEKEESKIQSDDSEDYIQSLINKKPEPLNLRQIDNPLPRIGRGRSNWDTS